MYISSSAPEFDVACRRCPRLSDFLTDVARQYPDYYAKPVPPFGDPQAKLLIVGLAPGMHGANRTGRPFTGDHAGILLYQTLYDFGFGSQPVSECASDRLELMQCRISNAVKCLPPQNKPVTTEIKNCNHFLQAELMSLPEPGVILALGKIAHDAVLRAFAVPLSHYRFAHAAEHRLGGRVLLDSYHCSRYNTNTRRLTESMFHDVFRRAHELVG
ncbi:MAG TPA: uracil-DNA glycosylase [Gammaproteobacteria bacterium]|nr:uracil-DNA glycosylase [Gammaproteobacteria bacterium]